MVMTLEYCAFGEFFAIVFGEADPPSFDCATIPKVERVVLNALAIQCGWPPTLSTQRRKIDKSKLNTMLRMMQVTMGK